MRIWQSETTWHLGALHKQTGKHAAVVFNVTSNQARARSTRDECRGPPLGWRRLRSETALLRAVRCTDGSAGL